MANIVITNNGDESTGDLPIVVTDQDGNQTVIKPGACTGFDISKVYTVQVGSAS